MSAEILTAPRVDVAPEVSDADEDLSGWFCISTNPYPCPATGCAFVASYATACHMIVVWPRVDDSALFANAENCKLADRNPRIVEYQASFGPAISYDRWVRLGRPVHAVGPPPDGYRERSRSRL